jgi:hypothetical protein
LHDALVAMATELVDHKRALLAASLDGTPLAQVDSPRSVVERVIANIAPTVQEIARRSLTPGELVIKRLVSETQREELFLSKAELAQKLEALPLALRRAFDPLALWEATPSAPPAAAPKSEVAVAHAVARADSASHAALHPSSAPVPSSSSYPSDPATASVPPASPPSQNSMAAEGARPEVGETSDAAHAVPRPSRPSFLSQRTSSRPPRP